MKLRLRGGFTLIELLLVIGIIAILAAIVIVAINPTKQLADARNAQRRSDVATILNGLYQYSIDNGGNFPPSTLTGSVNYQVCNITANPSALTNAIGPTSCIHSATDAEDGVVLSPLIPTFLVGIPHDPKIIDPATATGTNYWVQRTNGRLTVSAPGAEQGAVISVSR